MPDSERSSDNRVEELLARWAAAKLDVPRDDVTSVEFRHEDGEGNDSGTWWPEENYAVVMLGRRKREISIDGIEGLTGFIREVLAHDNASIEPKENECSP